MKRNKPVDTIRRSLHGGKLSENVEATVVAFGGNIYDMILVASARARQLAKGAAPKIETTHKPTVTALLEIEAKSFS